MNLQLPPLTTFCRSPQYYAKDWLAAWSRLFITQHGGMNILDFNIFCLAPSFQTMMEVNTDNETIIFIQRLFLRIQHQAPFETATAEAAAATTGALKRAISEDNLSVTSKRVIVVCHGVIM